MSNRENLKNYFMNFIPLLQESELFLKDKQRHDFNCLNKLNVLTLQVGSVCSDVEPTQKRKHCDGGKLQYIHNWRGKFHRRPPRI